MNTLKSLSERLRNSRQGHSDTALARLTGLTRQSIARVMSGDENFNVTTLLAIAEATGQQVLVVPNKVARARETWPDLIATSNMSDAQKDKLLNRLNAHPLFSKAKTTKAAGKTELVRPASPWDADTAAEQ